MMQWVVDRDARWYPQPERFDPDRWLPAAVEGRPRFAFFPFGAGTRRCIGEGLAWMEGKPLLATLLRDWGVVAAGGRRPRPGPPPARPPPRRLAGPPPRGRAPPAGAVPSAG